jgi:hypothetical protein
MKKKHNQLLNKAKFECWHLIQKIWIGLKQNRSVRIMRRSHKEMRVE